MDFSIIFTASCVMSMICMGMLGVVGFSLATTGGRSLVNRVTGMLGMDESGGGDPAPAASAQDARQRRRPSRSRIQEKAQSFRSQSLGGDANPPPQREQLGSQQASGQDGGGMRPSRPSLSQSRRFQQGSSSGNRQAQGQSQQRNRQGQQQQQRSRDPLQPQQPLQGNFGETLGQSQQRNQPAQPPQQSQSSPGQRQPPQQNQGNQPALRGGNRWQGDAPSPQRPQQGRNQQQQQGNQPPPPPQSQGGNNQQQGGLGEYRPQLRGKPNVDNTSSSGISRNRGRDNRFQDDREYYYGDQD